MTPDNLRPRNGLLAVRVSTPGQGIDGDSPDAQIEQGERFAPTHNINIIKTLTYLESASGEIQPMQNVVDYAVNPKNGIEVVIIKSIDRFTRGGSTAYDLLKQQLEPHSIDLVDIYGVISNTKVNTLEHLNEQYKWSVFSPSRKTELLEAERAKDEVRDILSRMIGAQIRYARLGYWVRASIYGFINDRIESPNGKRGILVKHPEEAPFVRKMFDLRCQGTLSDPQIVDEINRMGYVSRVYIVRDKNDRTRIVSEKGKLPLSLKVFWRVIQNPTYVGINSERWTQDKPVRCKFDGLVSIETFNKANRGKIIITEEKGEISIKRRQPPEWAVKKGIRNADFPYKRFVMCPHCTKPLYGSASRGKLGKYYPAYHCTGRGHNFRVPKGQFDETIAQFVEKVRVTPERIEALNSIILAEWEKRQGQLHTDQETIDQKIAALRIEAQLTMDKIKFLSSEMAIKYMEEDLLRIEKQINNLEAEKVTKVEKEPMNIQVVLSYVRYFLEHLEYLLLQQIDGITRANYFAVLFDKLPTYQEIILGTQDLSKITGLNEVFRVLSMPEGHVVQGEGFEPPKAEANRFTVCRV